jgi:hypothetical protein
LLDLHAVSASSLGNGLDQRGVVAQALDLVDHKPFDFRGPDILVPSQSPTLERTSWDSTPCESVQEVIRLFHENNAFFLGRLGNHPVVLCMCSMGASGRDSAQIVTGSAPLG